MKTRVPCLLRNTQSVCGLWMMLFWLAGESSYAQQDPTFRAGVVAGFNFSQIDGDNLAGYNKIGFNAGGKAYAFLEPKLSLSFELLFSQKGSQSVLKRTPPEDHERTTISYAEIPVLLNYHDKKQATIGAGLSYSRFLFYRRIVGGADVTDIDVIPVGGNDLAFVADGMLLIGQHFGLNLRFSYSIVPIGHSANSAARNQGLFNNVVSLRGAFVF